MISKQKMVGLAGEYMVCAELCKVELNCIPVNETCAYDIVLDYGRLLKVQVKTSNYSTHNHGIKFAVCRRGYNHNTTYEKRDVDLFALVWLAGNKIAYLPFEEVNKWKKTIRFEEFDLYTLDRALSMIEGRVAEKQ